MRRHFSEHKFFYAGVLGTILYFAFLSWLTSREAGSGEPLLQFLKQENWNEIGDFLAGVFGPLALFWLIISYWMQSEELRSQRLQLEANRLEVELVRKEQEMARREFELSREEQELQRKMLRESLIIQQNDAEPRLELSLSNQSLVVKCTQGIATDITLSADAQNYWKDETRHQLFLGTLRTGEVHSVGIHPSNARIAVQFRREGQRINSIVRCALNWQSRELLDFQSTKENAKRDPFPQRRANPDPA